VTTSLPVCRVAKVKPFVMPTVSASAHAHRRSTAQWARDYNETKEWGGGEHEAHRRPDRSGQVLGATGIVAWNDAAHRGLEAGAARGKPAALRALNAIYDATLAVFDAVPTIAGVPSRRSATAPHNVATIVRDPS
jgi:hypothetical protein